MVKNLVFLVICVLVGFFAGRFLPFVQRSDEKITKIKTIYDTVRITAPTAKISTIKPINVALPRVAFREIRDTICIHKTDTVYVAIDYETRTYDNERYTAVIAGPKIGEIRPELKNITIYDKTIVQTQKIKQKPKFAITAGIGAGYDFANKRFAPVVGVSAGFVIWSK